MENDYDFGLQLAKSNWFEFVELVKLNFQNKIDNLSSNSYNLLNEVIALDIVLHEYKGNLSETKFNDFFSKFNNAIKIANIKIIGKTYNQSIVNLHTAIHASLLPLTYEFEITSPSRYKSVLDMVNKGTIFSKLLQEKTPKSELEQVLKQAKASRDKIIALERELLGSSGESGSVKMKITEIYNTLESKRAAIVDFHDKLTKGDTAESSIELQINTAKDKAVETAKKLAQRYDETHEVFENLNAFHDKIFGKKDAVGNSIGGLEQEFDHKRKTLDDITDEHKKVYEAQVVEIENLLPGATSAGLSDAFSKMRLSFDKPIKWYSGIFYFALAGIFMCGAILVVKSISSAGIEFNQYSNPQQLLNNLLLKLPFLIPLLWLAIFASKRRSENIRLQQEYAHKEVIAKSYEGFKKQITDLGGKNDQLMVELIAKAIIALSFNPSTTLDGKHGDKPPFIAAVEKLITRAEKLVPENKVSKEK